MKKILPAILIIFFSSCGKVNDWLDVKRGKSDVMPSTLQDYQAIMDNILQLNANWPILALAGTDNLFVSDDNYGSLSVAERNVYTFAKDIFEGQSSGEFAVSYIKISTANIVLEGLSKAGLSADRTEVDNVRGQALFLRALAYYYLAQTFCKPYDAATAATDAGLQLKLTADPNIVVQRSTLAQTYERIVADLQESRQLLPPFGRYTSRASRQAANALLAKVHLVMEDYGKAYSFADEALTAGSTLLDFNSPLINPQATFPFPAYANTGGNPEYIFYAASQTYIGLWPVYGVQYADSTLYRSYDNNDLRKTLFYKSAGGVKVQFTGAYSGTYYNFGGLAVNEVLLIRAECHARLGRAAEAMEDLNALLVKRWSRAAAYTPLTAANAADALHIVLTERRKELAFTGLCRWEDLRRLNKDPRFAQTIVHIAKGIRYELPPGDKRYTLPFPDNEIQLSGVQQNER